MDADSLDLVKISDNARALYKADMPKEYELPDVEEYIGHIEGKIISIERCHGDAFQVGCDYWIPDYLITSLTKGHSHEKR
jgi:hypothetical protein